MNNKRHPDWQAELHAFSAAIRCGAALPEGCAVGTRYPLQRGLEVYRNNYRGNLQDTLAAVYPVLQQLVGAEFFRMLARHYIEQHPSRSGNLHGYGGEMSTFLRHYAAVQHLPYLPDVAQLEWIWHRAYFADDVAPFALQRLAALAPHDYAQLRWQLHPACQLLASDYPLSAIWLAHQPGSPDDFQIDLRSGGERLLVHRTEAGVEISQVDAAAWHWLSRVQQGRVLSVATAATLAEYADFDLPGTLRHWLAQGVLCDFVISPREQT